VRCYDSIILQLGIVLCHFKIVCILEVYLELQEPNVENRKVTRLS